jgi:HlyD family secretion protein
MNKWWRVLLVIVLVIVAAGAIYRYTTRPKTTPTTEIKTSRVSRGDIQATINATGSLVAERVATLTFSSSGRVAQVLVQEGQEVKAGQELARLDTTDLALSLKQAQAALRVSEASLARAQKTASETDLAAAKAAVESAKAQLQALYQGPSATERELARLNIDQAKNSLWGAQGNRDAIVGNPMSSGGSKATAEAQVANAELAVKIAELNYAKLLEKPKDSAIKAAEAQIAQAEANLARLLNTPAPEDLAVAQAQVEQARVAVEIAQRRLDDAVLTAPFSGKVASLKINPGDAVSPATPVATLVDLSRFYVDVTIDETEIRQVALGQPVRINLDAFPEEALTGRVARIDLVANAAQGLVSYGVRIELDPTGLPLRPGMTASIEIIVQEKKGVLLVPNRALARDKDGKYVEVLRNGVPTRVYVTTGVSNDTVTEVVSGLEENQEVVTSRPQQSVFGGQGLFSFGR